MSKHEDLLQQPAAASNVHPQNVLSSTILKLQAKAAFKEPPDAQWTAQSIMSKVGASVPRYTGTEVSKNFIKSYLTGWQAHLQRIAYYLASKVGVW